MITIMLSRKLGELRVTQLYSRPIAMPRYYTPFIFAASVVS